MVFKVNRCAVEFKDNLIYMSTVNEQHDITYTYIFIFLGMDLNSKIKNTK